MYISEKSSINMPFTFSCAHGMAEETALVDSSATENFMDERMVTRLGIGKRPMKQPHRVFNVDGSENKNGMLTHYCMLRVQKGDKEELQKFYIAGLGEDRAILGYPWLRVFNPRINWDEGHVLGPPVEIEKALLKWVKQWNAREIVAAATSHEEWEPGDEIIANITQIPSHAAQQWAIKANKSKPKDAHVLPKEYQRHERIFSEAGAERFPPSRATDMAVKLKPEAPETMDCKIYPMSRAELEEWKNFVAKNKCLGRIMDSKLRWASQVFFIKKKDGSYRLIQDYQGVNKWTERELYPMPRIDLILDQLHGKTLFMALDIRDGYNNIRVRPEDQWKLAFKGPDRHYEPKVMFFGMSNVPAVFQWTIDGIFAPLKKLYPGCIFTYMDDILIATGDDEQLHSEIVHAVLDMLEKEDFFLKLSKCLFHQTTIDYLGIRIEGGCI
jgi:hypothetical protein